MSRSKLIIKLIEKEFEHSKIFKSIGGFIVKDDLVEDPFIDGFVVKDNISGEFLVNGYNVITPNFYFQSFIDPPDNTKIKNEISKKLELYTVNQLEKMWFEYL